jgi:hypothetical protein
MRKSVLIGSVVIVVAVVGTVLVLRLRSPSVSQPLAFNHKLHVEGNGLECVECHIYVKTQSFSGLPGVEKCMECHSDPVTKSPEEEKIRQAAAKGEQLVWGRLYKIPDNVYYSHRRHVVAGKLECAECHGPIAATTRPPSRPLKKIKMDSCLDCHRKNGVPTDCTTCHR